MLQPVVFKFADDLLIKYKLEKECDNSLDKVKEPCIIRNQLLIIKFSIQLTTRLPFNCFNDISSRRASTTKLYEHCIQSVRNYCENMTLHTFLHTPKLCQNQTHLIFPVLESHSRVSFYLSMKKKMHLNISMTLTRLRLLMLTFILDQIHQISLMKWRRCPFLCNRTRHAN